MNTGCHAIACLGAAAFAVAVAPATLADTVRQYGNMAGAYLGKDAGMASGTHGNRGDSSNHRIGKPGANGWQNYAIYDWRRSNIVANLEQAATVEGWTNLATAYAAGAVKVELGLCVVQWENPATVTGKTARVGFFNSETAWAEGDGTDQDTGYNWSTGTTACTDYYAVDVHPGEGTPVPWRANGTNLVNFRQFTVQWNSVTMTNFIPNQFIYVVLDPSLWWNYLHATNAGPGLVTRDGGTGGNENLSVYNNGQNTSSDPELRGTVRTWRPASGTVLGIR